jgi:outer membrane biosynthesis protein TonB
VLISFAGANWYSPPRPGADVGVGSTFSALHHNAEALGVGFLVNAYFSWLSWILLISVIVVGTLASMAGKHADTYRVAGLTLGLVGAAMTYYALNEIQQASQSSGVFDRASTGILFVFTGFLLAGAGSAVGPWPFQPLQLKPPQLKPKPEPVPPSQPAAKLKPELVSEAAPAPEPEPEPVPKPDPKPDPGPKPVPKPVPKPGPKAGPKPGPKPGPQPGPQAGTTGTERRPTPGLPRSDS